MFWVIVRGFMLVEHLQSSHLLQDYLVILLLVEAGGRS
jgi:hypothetical protein